MVPQLATCARAHLPQHAAVLLLLHHVFWACFTNVLDWSAPKCGIVAKRLQLHSAQHRCLPVRSAVAGVLGTRGGLLGDCIAGESRTLSLVDWAAADMLLDMRAAFRPAAFCLVSVFGLLAASVFCLLQGAAFSLCSQTLCCRLPLSVGLML